MARCTRREPDRRVPHLHASAPEEAGRRERVIRITASQTGRVAYPGEDSPPRDQGRLLQLAKVMALDDADEQASA